jgi:hypothetical protein
VYNDDSKYLRTPLVCTNDKVNVIVSFDTNLAISLQF